jgi:hypothetical protein
VCKFHFVVKARGPIPLTCSRRCAYALALREAFKRGVNMPLTLLNKDIAAMSRRAERKRRHEAIIDAMLSDIGVRRRRSGSRSDL